MMKKNLFALLLTGCMLLSMAACGTTQDANAGTDTPVTATEPTTAPAPVAKTVSPLPITIDMNNLTDCTVAVSFEKGNAFIDDSGKPQLKVKIYTYDLYDMVDIGMLAVGDTILLRGKEVPVTDLVRTESGGGTD